MQSLLLIGAAMGAGFVLFGYAARTPGQTSLSNAVIAIGVSTLAFVAVVTAIKYFNGRAKTS